MQSGLAAQLLFLKAEYFSELPFNKKNTAEISAVF